MAYQADKRAIEEFLKREGQFLLPMVELLERTEVAIDVVGPATGLTPNQWTAEYCG